MDLLPLLRSINQRLGDLQVAAGGLEGRVNALVNKLRTEVWISGFGCGVAVGFALCFCFLFVWQSLSRRR